MMYSRTCLEQPLFWTANLPWQATCSSPKMANSMQTNLLWAATCLQRPLFVCNRGGCSREVLLYCIKYYHDNVNPIFRFIYNSAIVILIYANKKCRSGIICHFCIFDWHRSKLQWCILCSSRCNIEEVYISRSPDWCENHSEPLKWWTVGQEPRKLLGS